MEYNFNENRQQQEVTSPPNSLKISDFTPPSPPQSKTHLSVPSFIPLLSHPISSHSPPLSTYPHHPHHRTMPPFTTTILLLLLFHPSSSYPFDIAYHIDSGSSTTTTTDKFNTTWLSDRFFTSGSTGLQTSRYGEYIDIMFYTSDGDADVCFFSIATDSPVVGSIQLVQIDPDSYESGVTGKESTLLVNYGRLSCGSNKWGMGFSNDVDVFGRVWDPDVKYRSKSTGQVKSVTAVRNVKNSGIGPNYFPAKLYDSAVMVSGTGDLEYELAVDAKLDYLVWLHFAEIDVSVNRKGKRVFDVVINGVNVTRIDIFKEVGGFAAYSYHYIARNLSGSPLTVKLVHVVGSPLICGLENYAIVPADIMTVPEQAIAMQALKESLRVPERMGWNGDPCAPTNWDSWEGVTCHPNKDESALVIFQIDLGSQGLKGYISDKIVLLTNLVSLNLSSNSLGGTLPVGLGQNSLKKLDLSNNQISGSIPDSLGSSNLQLVLLNGNKLEGQVPEELYSVGVHGGAIDLYGNKGLCGVPSLPDCPLFRGISHGTKIAIGVSCGVVFLLVLVIIFICIRRRRHDYDFALPHELVSLAAKKNKYQTQKSLMALEMESQHAKGFMPNYNSD
ncbi:putative non-specific serine/threonine protein kinase [Helianthus debilis subsp. tardiflorus]